MGLASRFACAGLVALLSAACTAPPPQTKDAPAKTALSEPEGAASSRRLRVMTEQQYTNTLYNIFGPDLRFDARFAPMARTNGLLGNGAAIAGVSDAQLEQYQRTASLVATAVTSPAHRPFVMPCTPKVENGADAVCAGKFLTHVGRLLFRHPLEPAQAAKLVGEAGSAAERLKDFHAGLAYALEGMLMSPEMLLITEKVEADPKRPGSQRLDAYSLATRLSLFLWNSAPDSALLDAAESGEIMTPKGRARIVDMMLASPRLETGVRAFFDDMLAFDDFTTLAKDPETYPFFTGITSGDAREQTLRTIFDHLITRNADYRELFTTRKTFMSTALAPLYGVPAGRGWVPYEFPADSPRSGILTHISFLAVHSHPGRSSPTLRGKALRELLLCQRVPPPPPNVDFSAVENPTSPIKTQRERVTIHLQNPVCAGCHKITDPMGLALENFDGAGAYRTEEKGERIDPSGSLDGKAFTDVAGLGTALRDHPALISCLVDRTYSYATGGAVDGKSKPILGYLNEGFAAGGYRFPQLLRTIAMSNAFADIEAPAPAARAALEPSSTMTLTK